MTTVNVTRGDTTIVRIITAGPQGPAGGGGGAGTDLSYDATTRTIASSTGTDAVLPVATTALAGLESAADKLKIDSITVDSATLVRKYVRNVSGVTIPKGAAVYQTGSSGTTITVALADASAEATAAQTLGLAQETIAHNANGYVVAVGLLDGISTSTLTEGQIVWLSETAGEGTSTRPTQPAHGVVLGYCVKQGPGTSGILYVKVDNGLELEELHDVLVTGATTDQALVKASDGLWKNKTITPALIGAATAAQGSLADSAVQPATLSSYLTIAAAAGTYQPLDADLTSIAALTTTTFGRSLLTQADADAARTTLGSAAAGAIGFSGLTMTAGILGRETGTGAPQVYSIGSGLAIVGGALVVTAGGTGTVTSVGLSLPAIFSVTGSPVTTSGTLAATLATQAANLVFAGPSSGAAAAPTFRQLGYSELSGLPTLGGAAALNVGTTAGTVAAGDDSRLTTDLAYTASTRLLSSSTGADATLPLFSDTDAGLVPASGGGTTNFLRADGTFAAPPGGSGASFLGYAVNNWIQPAIGTVGPGTASTANTIYLYPFMVQRSITVSDLGARVTTAGTNFALAIYGSASGLPTGLPLANTGTLVGTAATVVPSTVTAFNLTAGTLYWGAFNSDAVIAMMHLAGANTYFNTIIGTATLSEIASGGSISSWVRTLSGQTFTNPWPNLTGVTTTVITTATTLRGALIFLKVSALL